MWDRFLSSLIFLKDIEERCWFEFLLKIKRRVGDTRYRKKGSQNTVVFITKDLLFWCYLGRKGLQNYSSHGRSASVTVDSESSSGLPETVSCVGLCWGAPSQTVRGVLDRVDRDSVFEIRPVGRRTFSVVRTHPSSFRQ